jgi:hypothetical protein
MRNAIEVVAAAFLLAGIFRSADAFQGLFPVVGNDCGGK